MLLPYAQCHCSAVWLQATRPARKIYVGSLPVASSEAEITHFFNQMMVAAKATTPNMPGQPVLSCYINHEKRFAFVEFRTVEEASNAMALDGLGYRGETLRVRREPPRRFIQRLPLLTRDGCWVPLSSAALLATSCTKQLFL